MLGGIFRKFFFLSVGVSLLAGIGGSACIGGGSVTPPGEGIGPPLGAAAPEVLGSVTEAPQVTESCYAKFSMRFVKESAASDGPSVVLTILPGQNSEYENAVVEELSTVPNSSLTQRIHCERCKKRLIRMLDFGVATGNSSGKVTCHP